MVNAIQSRRLMKTRSDAKKMHWTASDIADAVCLRPGMRRTLRGWVNAQTHTQPDGGGGHLKTDTWEETGGRARDSSGVCYTLIDRTRVYWWMQRAHAPPRACVYVLYALRVCVGQRGGGGARPSRWCASAALRSAGRSAYYRCSGGRRGAGEGCVHGCVCVRRVVGVVVCASVCRRVVGVGGWVFFRVFRFGGFVLFEEIFRMLFCPVGIPKDVGKLLGFFIVIEFFWNFF